MQGTCLKQWCTWNYIFMLTLFTFDPGEVAWISFGPKNAACSQNSLDSGRLLHPWSVVSMPCALDQAVVVHDPPDESPASQLLSTMAGNASVLGSENTSFSTLFGRLIAMEADQYWCGSAYIHLSGRILLYIIQGSLTGLHCRDEIVCPLIQHALQAIGPGATFCRTPVPLLTELRSSQISCRPLSRFGSCKFLDNE